MPVETVEAPLTNGFVFARRAGSPWPPRRICSARGATRAPRPGSRAGARSRSPTSWSRATTRCTGSTAWDATSGITHRELAGAERDYLILEYAEGDKLFVPSDQVGMVARYVGGDAPAAAPHGRLATGRAPPRR